MGSEYKVGESNNLQTIFSLIQNSGLNWQIHYTQNKGWVFFALDEHGIVEASTAHDWFEHAANECLEKVYFKGIENE